MYPHHTMHPAMQGNKVVQTGSVWWLKAPGYLGNKDFSLASKL